MIDRPELPSTLQPRAMTDRWLAKRTDAELALLAAHYDPCYSRGGSIDSELRRRGKDRDSIQKGG